MPEVTPRTPPRASAALAPIHSQSPAPATPRKRKQPTAYGLQGTKALSSYYKPSALASRLKQQLKLKFDPDPWQLALLSHLLRGFDAILCAGTGYGKSLIFEGLAVLAGRTRAVLVISPLKALERDQVQQANAKGILALMINEDNSHEGGVWEMARKSGRLIYLSPEMSLSDGFAKLWRDGSFRRRLAAVAVDEAHCVEEWGKDDFRPLYRDLHILRHYTGQEIPFLACTATPLTPTFERLWTSLAYGYRPFWGLDVGSDRPNLYFDVREITHPKNLVLDILNILPAELDMSTTTEAIPKSIVYFDSEDQCRSVTDSLRKCLPPHLRDIVYAFSSIISEKAKRKCWDGFNSGRYRILMATDAAGMGCNVPDIRYVVVVGVPRSISVVAQRWGRAGRDRVTQATCLLLVPKWAFRPEVPPGETLPSAGVQRLKGKAKVSLEPPRHTEQRSNLPEHMEAFINLKPQPDGSGCLHRFLREVFSPITQLTTYLDLENHHRLETGARSTASAYALSWTVVDLRRHPPAGRCCRSCNPDSSERIVPATLDDPRVQAFAADFVIPIIIPPSRPSSRASVASRGSQTSDVAFQPLAGQHSVPSAVLHELRASLKRWRGEFYVSRRDYLFMSVAVDFPDKVIEELVMHAPSFLSKADIRTSDVRKIVSWDSASEEELDAVIVILDAWRYHAALSATPKSQRRKSKKSRRGEGMPSTPKATLPSDDTTPRATGTRTPRGGARTTTPRAARTPSSLTASLYASVGSTSTSAPMPTSPALTYSHTHPSPASTRPSTPTPLPATSSAAYAHVLAARPMPGYGIQYPRYAIPVAVPSSAYYPSPVPWGYQPFFGTPVHSPTPFPPGPISQPPMTPTPLSGPPRASNRPPAPRGPR